MEEAQRIAALRRYYLAAVDYRLQRMRQSAEAVVDLHDMDVTVSLLEDLCRRLSARLYR